MTDNNRLTIHNVREQIVGVDTQVPMLDGTLRQYVNFDNAASTPALRPVYDKVNEFMTWYSSVHRGTGFKSQISTEAYEWAHDLVGCFVGANLETNAVIFGKNTTEAINIASVIAATDVLLYRIPADGSFVPAPVTDGALTVTAAVTLIGAAWMAPVGWIEIQRTGFSLAGITPVAWLAIAYLGACCNFLAVLLYFTALGDTESQKVGVYLYAIPPMTAVAAALVLAEPITLGLVVGITVGLAIAQFLHELRRCIAQVHRHFQ